MQLRYSHSVKGNRKFQKPRPTGEGSCPALEAATLQCWLMASRQEWGAVLAHNLFFKRIQKIILFLISEFS